MKNVEILNKKFKRFQIKSEKNFNKIIWKHFYKRFKSLKITTRVSESNWIKLIKAITQRNGGIFEKNKQKPTLTLFKRSLSHAHSLLAREHDI